MHPASFDRDPARLARYSEGAGIYRIVPRGVARPEDRAALDALLAEARATGAAVIPRGAGSAMDGSSVGDALLLDLTRLDGGACTIDPSARTAVVAPSCTFAALSAEAARHGLRLPPDPSSGGWATLGGMVSTNASGARTVRYGSIRPWVLGCTLLTDHGELVLSRGATPDPRHPIIQRANQELLPLIRECASTIHERFPRVRKNSAGYALDQFLLSGDLLDLVIGSEGTLGVLTAITLRLDPIPAARASLRVLLRDRVDLVEAIRLLGAEDPSTLEYLDRTFLALVDPATVLPEQPGMVARAAGLLLADYEGDEAADVAARVAKASGRLGARALSIEIATSPQEIERLWQVRHGASPVLARLTDGRRSLQVIEDGCVPPSALARYLDAIDAAAGRQDTGAVIFGHAGDGHLHVNLLPDVTREDWLPRVRAIYAEVTEAVLALGGTLSGEHGAGRLRSPLLGTMYGDRVMACFAAVKRTFDPAGRWNPGVIVDAADDPFERLKVGAKAAPLPAGVAEWLRRVEREAGWGVDRWSAP